MIDIIAAIKQIQGVDRVVWSAEIFKFPINNIKIPKLFNKYNTADTNIKHKKTNKQKRKKIKNKSHNIKTKN